MVHDDTIARLLRRVFLKDARLCSQLIDIEVRERHVVLGGRARSEQERLLALELATKLPGVRSVSNNIKVVPRMPRSDSAVAEDVRRALERNRRVVKESIIVTVHAGDVTLTGTVRGDEERALARDIALAVEGVGQVWDELFVNALRQIEDASLARKVREAISDAVPDAANCVRVAIANGIGVLSGCVSAEAQRRAAAKVAREFALDELRNEIRLET